MKLGRYVLLSALCLVACKRDDASTTAKTDPTDKSAPDTNRIPAKPDPSKPEPTPTPNKSSDPWSKPAPKKEPIAHPLLWAAAKDGKTTYFLGTMHLGVDAEARLPPIVWKRLDDAPAFAMETDLQSQAAIDSQSHMTLTKGTLHDELGPDYWKKLEDALGPDVASRLDGMKPMVPATLLSMRGLPQTPPMDGVLRAHAENEHKQLVFLEDAAKDTAILEKWLDAKALKNILDDLDDGEKRQKDMLAAYVAGDDKKLVQLSDEEKAVALKHGYTQADYDAEMKDLLLDRNKSWIEPLEKMHAAGGGFVAVGALHLVGPGSVLDLLQKDGFQVSRVDN